MGGSSWDLVADIGGTNARFALVKRGSPELLSIRHYGVADYGTLDDALRQFLSDIRASELMHDSFGAACLAVASAENEDRIKFTNSPWEFSGEEVSESLGGARVDVINDFAAVGHAVTALTPVDYQQLGGGEPLPDRPLAVLGPGTGLGVCSVAPIRGGYRVLDGEGGHVDFAPIGEREEAVKEILARRYGRVSLERLLSGPGLLETYQALAELDNVPAVHASPAEVTAAALGAVDELAGAALHLFCSALGTAAGNLALTLGAKGGVYLAGGIVPRILGFLAGSEFRTRFEAKGRFSSYVQNIPVRAVTRDNLGLYGAAIWLAQSRSDRH